MGWIDEVRSIVGYSVEFGNSLEVVRIRDCQDMLGAWPARQKIGVGRWVAELS
ncbi:MAG TPA: hypothetical protein VIT43_02400 [Candidatus Dormibacteraeota bacterium]